MCQFQIGNAQCSMLNVQCSMIKVQLHLTKEPRLSSGPFLLVMSETEFISGRESRDTWVKSIPCRPPAIPVYQRDNGSGRRKVLLPCYYSKVLFPWHPRSHCIPYEPQSFC